MISSLSSFTVPLVSESLTTIAQLPEICSVTSLVVTSVLSGAGLTCCTTGSEDSAGTLASLELGSLELGSVDSGSLDSGSPELGSLDSGSLELGSVDSSGSLGFSTMVSTV